MHRRHACLTLASAAALSTLRLPSFASEPAASRNGLGLQLWTVRNQMTADAKSTLKAVAQAGYKQIELMNVLESQEIAQVAKDLGLAVKSAFFNWETIAKPDDKAAPKMTTIIEGAKKIGLEHLVFGYIGREQRNTADKLKAICERANKAAEEAKSAGLSVCYHNHSFEFEKLDGEKTGYDLLIDGFDPKLITFEVDVFWVAIGGWDPLATLERLGKRTSQIHLKDLKAGVDTITDEGKVPVDAFQEVGDGTIDMKKVLALGDKFGVKQYHVEQDQSPDPLASIKQSYAFTKSIW